MVLIKHGINLKHSIANIRMRIHNIDEVSASSGISKRKLRAILNYELDLDLDMLIKIAASLNVSPCELIEEDLFESKYKRIIEGLETKVVKLESDYLNEKNKVERLEKDIKQLQKEVELKAEIIDLLRGK
ncbi:hypothetical protein [Lentimicrobium sp. S6]|uniref:hypothetical protein n=1 Tax=Lentimicrobium sp. S6 TaxID=2735872 RepID=UPI001556DE26|nr:hypothetical protein [Lentimicrobium sp. S6]NPD48068.1 hypothetical protein [Lentimicrobium sp. S6]